jgi:O-antigen/teichoic acid export membrane protein
MIHRLKKSAFVRNISTLFIGSVLAQLVPLILSPFISRVFSADDVAVFGLYTSVLGVLSVIASLRYDMAIVVPRDEKDSEAILVLSILLSVIVAGVLFIVQYFFGSYFVEFLGNDRFAFWIQIVPLALMIIGFYQALNYYLIRRKMFIASALNKVAQRSSEGAGNLITGLSHVPAGLIISDLLGRFFALLVSLFQIRKTLPSLIKVKFPALKKVAKEFKHYPLNLGPSSLANAASLNFPLFYISSAYTSSITGFFNFMRFVLSAPISFIGQNISQVFLERIAGKVRADQPILHDILRLTLVLLGFSVLFMLPIAVFGSDIFSLLFGEEWREAGLFAQIMTISFFFKFVVSPLSPALVAINRIKMISTWQWINFGFTLILFPISQMKIGITMFLVIYSSGEALLYVTYWLMIYWAAKSYDDKLPG